MAKIWLQKVQEVKRQRVVDFFYNMIQTRLKTKFPSVEHRYHGSYPYPTSCLSSFCHDCWHLDAILGFCLLWEFARACLSLSWAQTQLKCTCLLSIFEVAETASPRGVGCGRWGRPSAVKALILNNMLFKHVIILTVIEVFEELEHIKGGKTVCL